MKLYFIDRKGNRLEKSFTSIPDAMSEVYKAALLGWFVYDEDSNPITPTFLTDDCLGKVAVLVNGNEYVIEQGGYVLRYEINGYRYDTFGQGRGTPTTDDSIPAHLHVAYIKD